MSHYEKTGKKGHGCCGGIFSFILIVLVIAVLLLFCTDTLGDIKSKMLMKVYPQQYSEYVEEYAKEYGVDEALVYAVMRTESGFRAEVKSSVGAVGLMQIMPDTFEWLQTISDSQVEYTEDDLVNPQINIKYGTFYLDYLIDHYGGKEALAVAAYNGGIANVDSWLKDNRYSTDGKTLENIPYSETAQYVQRVEKTKDMYESLYYDNK